MPLLQIDRDAGSCLRTYPPARCVSNAMAAGAASGRALLLSCRGLISSGRASSDPRCLRNPQLLDASPIEVAAASMSEVPCSWSGLVAKSACKQASPRAYQSGGFLHCLLQRHSNPLRTKECRWPTWCIPAHISQASHLSGYRLPLSLMMTQPSTTHSLGPLKGRTKGTLPKPNSQGQKTDVSTIGNQDLDSLRMVLLKNDDNVTTICQNLPISLSTFTNARVTDS